MHIFEVFVSATGRCAYAAACGEKVDYFDWTERRGEIHNMKRGPVAYLTIGKTCDKCLADLKSSNVKTKWNKDIYRHSLAIRLEVHKWHKAHGWGLTREAFPVYNLP